MVIGDNFEGFDPELFTIPEMYKDCIETVLIPGGMVSDRLDKLALQVVAVQAVVHYGPK